MRYIKRFDKPNILVEKQKEWTEKFIDSGKDRPDSSKYGHSEIKSSLFAMSHNKCFYCETVLKGQNSEIDHYIEVSEDKNLAFEWNNLYLSCSLCNKKLSNKTISASTALNPCLDADSEIQNHIEFEDEQISFLTEKGELTIKKYKLSSEKLDWSRMQELKKFNNLLNIIKNRKQLENRDKLTTDEIDSLKRFARSDYPYSMMFYSKLQKCNIN